jgi:hypothetical protein
MARQWHRAGTLSRARNASTPIPGENPPGLTMPRSAGSCKLDLYNVFEADIRLKVNYVSPTTSVPLHTSD